MSDDLELLRRYVTEKSDEAFAGIVRQHLGLVYHTALRHLNGDTHAAEDVAQAVFTDLARKAPSLVDRALLAGWLHTSARYAALQRLRTERRRQVREQEAQLMQELTQEPGPPVRWEQMRPFIDDALHALNAPDREAVLLHYFEGRDFNSIAARLQLSPQGARSRVERALEKMQARLSHRGVVSTVAALATTLTGHAAGSAPASLVSPVIDGALAAAGTSSGLALNLGFLGLMKISTAILVASLAANGLLVSSYFGTSRAAVPGAVKQPSRVDATVLSLAAEPVEEPNPWDPVMIGRKLRAMGFSDTAVTAAVRSAVGWAGSNWEEQMGEQGRDRVRRWNPTPGASLAIAPGAMSTEFKAEAEQLRRDQALAELGYDRTGKPLASLYHGLSADKAVLVRRLEDDYAGIREAMMPRGNEIVDTTILQKRIATEFEADITAVLTPAEARDYFRWHSDTGKNVARMLGDLKVSDDSFAAIADAALAFDRRVRTIDRRAETTWEAEERIALLLELHRTYRRELGDEQFLRVTPRLSGTDIDRAYQQAGLSAGTRADLWLRAAEFMNAINRAPVAARQGIAIQARTALTTGAGLTPDQVAAFDATLSGANLKKLTETPAK